MKRNHVTTIHQGTFVPKSTLGTRLNERQRRSLFGKPEWELKGTVEFQTPVQVSIFSASQLVNFNVQTVQSPELTPSGFFLTCSFTQDVQLKIYQL